MRRLGIVSLVLLVPILASAGCRRSERLEARSKEARGASPNIILVVIDTARADHFSFAGYGRRTTPFIDRLAKDSVVYRNAHSVAPWTLPAHMSMFTGLLPGEHGATWAAFSQPSSMSLGEILARSPRLRAPDRMLPVLMREAGYSTLGISQNPWVSESRGFGTGFDRFIEGWKGGASPDHSCDAGPEAVRSAPQVAATSAACSLLLFEQHLARGQLRAPFFVFFNLTDPHFPYNAPEGFTFKFGPTQRDIQKMSSTLRESMAGQAGVVEMQLLAGARKMEQEPLAALYDGELNYVDSVIGQLVEWLTAKGLYRDSLIVVTSDHGEHLGEAGRYSHQLSMEEALLRIPLVVKYPKNLGANTVQDSPLVSNLDIYSTLLAAAGVGEKGAAAGGWPRDLARMDRFDRRVLPSEYYYSDAYLRQLVNVNPAFDIDAHRKVWRVFYADGRKYSFEGADLVKTEGSRAAPDDSRKGSEALVKRLKALIQVLDSQSALKQTDADRPSQETIEALRALGYVSY